MVVEPSQQCPLSRHDGGSSHSPFKCTLSHLPLALFVSRFLQTACTIWKRAASRPRDTVSCGAIDDHRCSTFRCSYHQVSVCLYVILILDMRLPRLFSRCIRLAKLPFFFRVFLASLDSISWLFLIWFNILLYPNVHDSVELSARNFSFNNVGKILKEVSLHIRSQALISYETRSQRSSSNSSLNQQVCVGEESKLW